MSLFLSLCLCQAPAMEVRAVPVLTEVEDRLAIPVETNEIENWPLGPEVSAQSAILMDANTGVILYAKNIHEQLYPASTTKILTCLIAAETCAMDEVVTFSANAVYDAEGSHIAIDVDEQLTMEQCLNAILIASANEVSFGVAEHITGSGWEDFAAIMNEKAAELGCVDSNFVNPNGLPHEEHYTSAYDLATIGRAFFANELLCKMSSTPLLELLPTDHQPDHILARSKNQLFPGQPYEYEYLVGSKTGYTNAARSTLVSCAEKDGMKLIAVVMVEDSPAQFADTVALFNYGFSNFEHVIVSERETRFHIDNTSFFYSNNDIFGSSKPILSLNTTDSIILPKTVAFEDITSTISYDTGTEGQAALITYTYNDIYLGSASIDFADNTGNTYAFEEGTMQPSSTEDTETEPEEKIVFVNVFKVITGIGIFAGIAILIALIVSFFRNYQFGTRERNDRRSWLKEQRRKRNRYQLSHYRHKRGERRRRRRRPKRSNRFRDYDF